MIMSSVARVKFIKTTIIFGYHIKGVSNAQTMFHHIRITKSKVIHVQIPVPKWVKTKKWEKFSGLQNGAMRGLQIGTGFRDYKSGQEGLQIGAVLGISNWGKEITNRAGISYRGKEI